MFDLTQHSIYVLRLRYINFILASTVCARALYMYTKLLKLCTHIPYFLEISLWRDFFFYFKAPFGAATIRGRLDFEGGIYRDRHARVYTASIISLFVCACAYGYCCRPLTMRRDFEGGVYWDELADRCGEISRAAGFRGAVRFRGNTVISNLR